jgi:proline dehydrogenase
MALLNSILHSKSPLLNLSNPIFYAIVRSTVYDHFNAGTTPAEVQRMISKIKKVGYQGVILGHAREVEQTDDPGPDVNACPDEVWISKWLELNLETLALVGRGDYINVKLSGAGPAVTAGLAANSPPSEQLLAGLDAIITKARDQGSRVWIDAEKQDVQDAIDEIVINLMRKYNRVPDSGSGPLVWNTIQAYLKCSRQNLERHVNLAGEEGWILGIKLVRGAYITTEERSEIWETKEGTDANYNAIVNDIVRGKVKGMDRDKEKGITPKIWLFAAGHNTESVCKAGATINELNEQGKPCPPVGFAQLQGMADELSCGLLCEREEMLKTAHLEKGMMVPEIHKCLSWGPVDECMGFLLRRTVENAGAADRIKEGTGVIRKELRRRMLRF